MRAFFGTLAGLALLTAVPVAHAQQRTGSSSSGGFTGSSSSGGLTGSSSGGFTGSSSSGGFSGGSSSGGFSGGSSSSGGFSGGSSSSGGFSGGSSSGGFSGSSSGGFTGSSSGSFASGTTGGSNRGGSSGQVGATSFLGSNYKNPMATSFGSGSTSGSSRGTTGTGAFGQPMYNVQNTATTSRTGTTGTTAGGLTTGGLNSGQNNQQGNAGFRGVTTAGVRRAPQYTTVPVFSRVTPTVAITSPGSLQDVLTTSSGFPAGSRLQVVGATGGASGVTLRGNVGSDREKRIAELMIRMTPGVREVKNDLVAPPPTTPSP